MAPVSSSDKGFTYVLHSVSGISVDGWLDWMFKSVWSTEPLVKLSLIFSSCLKTAWLNPWFISLTRYWYSSPSFKGTKLLEIDAQDEIQGLLSIHSKSALEQDRAMGERGGGGTHAKTQRRCWAHPGLGLYYMVTWVGRHDYTVLIHDTVGFFYVNRHFGSLDTIGEMIMNLFLNLSLLKF